MMSFSNNLDGKALPRGQGQEGKPPDPDAQEIQELKIRHEIHEALKVKYAAYLKYVTLTFEELMDYDQQTAPLHATPKEKYLHDERVSLVWAKIAPHDFKIIQDLESKLRNQRLMKKKHAHHELGSREFTLTYSPKWFSDEEARKQMSKAIDKLLKYYTDEIIQLRAIGEVGSNGLSHIHCFYKLREGKKITDKNFKRAYSYWNPTKKLGYKGFEGGHHDNVRSESDFLGYIDKDVEIAWLDKSVDNTTEDPEN